MGSSQGPNEGALRAGPVVGADATPLTVSNVHLGGPKVHDWHATGAGAAGRHQISSAEPRAAVSKSLKEEEADAQTSFVPVIPDSPPPAIDPLVKAVRELEPSAPQHTN